MSYFDWLCAIVIPDPERRVDYAKLLCTLMDTEFRWVVQRDKNRAIDGLELRDIFEEETGEGCDVGGPCSVLEMLIALAIRCNDEIMYDPDDPKRADRWFWMMIHNLGLDKNVGGFFSGTKVLSILANFMDKTGKNELFPVKNPPKNFYHMELWYQLNWYIMEHFGGDFC